MPCENYFVSFPLLHLSCELGVIISKVHEIYSLTQKSYLKDFINTNIEAKKNAVASDVKKLYKTFSNATFGKT